MIEEWRDIKEYNGAYQISNYGVVKSVSRFILKSNGQKFNVKEKILKPRISTYGYYVVNLSKDTLLKTFPIHKLVAIEFLNHIPSGIKDVIDHIDNNKLNNRLDNIQIISNRENTSKDRNNTSISSSKYTGVSWNKQHKKCTALISIDSKLIYLGSFSNEEEASNSYQFALSNMDLYNGNAKEFRQILNNI